MQPKTSTFVYIGLFAAAGLGLASCGEKTESKAATTSAAVTRPAAPKTVTLTKSRFSSEMQIPGELTAWQQVDLYAKVNSFVKKLYVDIGSEVSQGQLLVQLEAPEYGAQSAAASSRIKAQEAIYTASNASYNRLLETSKTPGTVSQNDLDLALARKRSDFAQLEAVKASLLEVSSINNYLQIRAPFAGVISARNVNTGAYVGSAGKGSELPMFTLQEQRRLRLSVSVPEAYAAYLKQGDEVSFRVRSMPSKLFKAKVQRQAGALDPRLRAERMEMDVDNRNKELLPGMVAEIMLSLNGNDSSFAVPKAALVSSAEGSFLIRVVGGKAQRVPVHRGRDNGDSIEVFGTINDGDVILAEGSEEIRDGSAVADQPMR
jgi:membrane fusion protein (multidrug efflux system)